MCILCVLLRSLARQRGGATALEYALIAALIAAPILPTTASVGKQLSSLMVSISAYLSGVPQTEPDPLSP